MPTVSATTGSRQTKKPASKIALALMWDILFNAFNLLCLVNENAPCNSCDQSFFSEAAVSTPPSHGGPRGTGHSQVAPGRRAVPKQKKLVPSNKVRAFNVFTRICATNPLNP